MDVQTCSFEHIAKWRSTNRLAPGLVAALIGVPLAALSLAAESVLMMIPTLSKLQRCLGSPCFNVGWACQLELVGGAHACMHYTECSRPDPRSAIRHAASWGMLWSV
eukprot:1775826-Amphidinium_carterae.1